MKRYKAVITSAGIAAVCAIGLAVPSMAAEKGWKQENGTWYYYDKDGSRVTDEWRKSGGNWYFLDDDGAMAVSSLVEKDDDYFYVNSAGAMVTNEWRQIENEDGGDEDEPYYYWYYFQSNGKAMKAGSDRTSFRPIKKADGQTKKYAFDDEGRMLTGWVSEDSERVTGEDAWKEGVYYCGGEDDGAQVVSSWARIHVEDDENEDDSDPDYWFYFNSTGKKVSDETKKINGKRYTFNEHGAAQYEWYQVATKQNASGGYQYFNNPEQCWRADGWFYTVPDEDVDPEAYSDDEAYWFYAEKGSGELIKSQFKNINGKKYAFNDKGEMLEGLFKIEFDENSSTKIASCTEIETEEELPDEFDSCEVFYFGTSPAGATETGKVKLELDGEEYEYGFQDSGSKKGAGYNGIHKDSIYIKGRKLKAEKEDKLAVVEYNDKEYLVNTSGTIAKNKKNVKDADDNYYCTDKDGVVIYQGADKYEKEK